MARWIRILAFLSLTAVSGCSQNGMVLKGQVAKLQQDQVRITQEYESLKTRAQALDDANQRLSSQVAQFQQEIQAQQDHIATLKTQLGDVTSQLAEARQEKQNVEKEYEILTASVRRRSGVSITPNNSFLRTLPATDVEEVHVRRDGDVIRIALPADALFEPGTVRFKADAVSLIDAVAAEVVRTYPDQRLGIEGHTDSTSAGAPNSKQLSAGQAGAVYELLVARSSLQPGQFYIAGHGANQPLVSNGTPAGQQRNRRVELVIYPEKWRQ